MLLFGLMYSAIVFIGLPLLLAVLLREAVLAVTPPRRLPAQPECDACRYPIRGLQGSTCPECGGDLMVTGIRTAAVEVRRRGNLLWGMVGWTGFMAIGGMTLASLSMALVGFGTMGGGGATATTASITITPVSGSGAPFTAVVNRTTNNDTGAVESFNIVLSTPAAPASTLSVAEFSGTGSVHWTDSNGAYRSPPGGPSNVTVDAAVVGAWIASQGPQPAAGLTDEEAAELARIVNEISAGTDPNLVSGGNLFTLAVTAGSTATVPSMTSFARAAWIPGVIGLVAMALWIAGLIVIPLRRSAIRRRFGVGAGRVPRGAAAAVSQLG